METVARAACTTVVTVEITVAYCPTRDAVSALDIGLEATRADLFSVAVVTEPAQVAFARVPRDAINAVAVNAGRRDTVIDIDAAVHPALPEAVGWIVLPKSLRARHGFWLRLWNRLRLGLGLRLRVGWQSRYLAIRLMRRRWPHVRAPRNTNFVEESSLVLVL